MRVLVSLFLLLLLFVNAVHATVKEVEIFPEKPVQGSAVKILIKAEPSEEVAVTITFTKTVTVSNGGYEYRLSGVNIPSAPNAFTVEAVNVNDLQVSVKVLLLFWVTKSVTAQNGVAVVSQSNVPIGYYDVKIFGNAVKDASTVTLQITASTNVLVDEQGYYEYTYDTSIMPAGTFTLRVGEITRTVTLYAPGTVPETIPDTGQPQGLTSENVERMTNEEAVQALNSITLEEAASLLDDVATGKTAKILGMMEAEKAANILELMTSNKSVSVMGIMPTEQATDIFIVLTDEEAKLLLEGLVENGFANKTAEILFGVDRDRAAEMVVTVKTLVASQMLVEMVNTNVTISAEVIERAANMNLTETARILNSTQTKTAAELLIEISHGS